MGYSSAITIATCVTTPEEDQALTAWSAHFLPLCQSWLARRGLRPPFATVAFFQKARFELPSWTLDDISPVLQRATSPFVEKTSRPALDRLASQLSADFEQYQRYIATKIPAEVPAMASATQLINTRDMQRFQRVSGYLSPGKICLTTTSSVLIPAFSPPKRALYLPEWLIQDMPNTTFPPTAAFYILRQTSHLWLLLDAIVLPSGERFQTL